MSVNIVEAPSTSSLANILDESSTTTNADSSVSNRLSNLSYSTPLPAGGTGGQPGTSLGVSVQAGAATDLDDSYEMIQDEPSFSETVLSESGMESVVGSARSGTSGTSRKEDKTEEDGHYEMIYDEFETAI